MESALTKALKLWAADWKNDYLNEHVRTLIAQSTYELWYGPTIGDWEETYPGFQSACIAILQALENLPSDLYINVEDGCWQEMAPDLIKCDTCDGEGEIILYHTDDLNKEDEIDRTQCPACKGRGCFDAEGWYKIDRQQLKEVVVGKELAQYV